MENFLNLGISKEIITNLNYLKLFKPTPVQQHAIKPAFDGKDILAIANTGTGKTAAFGIPIIQKLNENKKFTALIITPTRELSIQINKHLKDLMGRNIHIKSAVLIGGDSIKKQIKVIKQNPRLFIGTPGRIYDHLTSKNIKLNDIDILVLDETDRMLDLGFIEQIQNIINFLPTKKQTLLFSATLPHKIKKISAQYLSNPINISVEKKEKILENISHNIVNLKNSEKYSRLLKELDERSGSIIVFMKTKHSSKRLLLKLKKDGESVNAIHGNVRQNKRENILNKFRKQQFRVLVATDIAARGLDIPHIEHVINYDLPQRTEDYVHRIGRTARAGKKGSAVSFISENDKKLWNLISKLLLTEHEQKAEIKSRNHNAFKKQKKIGNPRKKNSNKFEVKNNFENIDGRNVKNKKSKPFKFKNKKIDFKKGNFESEKIEFENKRKKKTKYTYKAGENTSNLKKAKGKFEEKINKSKKSRKINSKFKVNKSDSRKKNIEYNNNELDNNKSKKFKNSIKKTRGKNISRKVHSPKKNKSKFKKPFSNSF